jgi:hypothetical protein
MDECEWNGRGQGKHGDGLSLVRLQKESYNVIPEK